MIIIGSNIKMRKTQKCKNRYQNKNLLNSQHFGIIYFMSYNKYIVKYCE